MIKHIIISISLCFCAGLSTQAQTDSLYTEAQRLYERGYFEQSLDALRQIPDDSLNVSNMELRYDNFSNLNQLDSLQYWADRLLRWNPYDTRILLSYTSKMNNYKGRNLFTTFNHNPQRSIELLEKYRERDSTHVLINRQLAEAYYNQGNYDCALPLLRQLEAVGDSCFGTLYTMGLTLQRMGDDSAAYDYLSRATQKTDDQNAMCLLVLGIVSNRIGFGAEALSYLEMAKERMMPDRRTLYRLHKELAEAFRQKGEFALRLEELQECVTYADGDELPELHYQMGLCHCNLQQLDKAKELLNQFLDETQNKEYNDHIKYMRQSAQRRLLMMQL